MQTLDAAHVNMFVCAWEHSVCGCVRVWVGRWVGGRLFSSNIIAIYILPHMHMHRISLHSEKQFQAVDAYYRAFLFIIVLKQKLIA